MQLDTRTSAVVAVFVTLVLGLLQALVWRTRQTYTGFGRWTIGNLLLAVCLLLMSLRAVLPDWISIVLANALTIIAAILFLEGSRQFRGLPLRFWPAYAAGGLAILAVIYFDYVTSNVNARICAMSGYIGFVGTCAAMTLLKNMPAGRRLGLAFTGTVFALCGAAQLSRAIYFYIQPPLPDLFAASAVNAAFFASLSLFVVSWSFGFVLMTNERLVTDLKDAEGRTASSNRELTQLQRQLEDTVEKRTTELKGAQEALRNANEILSTMVQAAPVAIVALDADGRITTWNHATERVFGWTEHEVLHRPLPFAQGALPQSMARAMSGEVLTGVHLECAKQDGSPIEVSLSGAPLRDASGNVTGSLFAFEDITERRRLEARLLQAQKLESVGRLAGGVAHDFNNILTVIGSYSTLLSRKLTEPGPLRDYVAQIAVGCEQARSLTQQLLAFSRRQTLQPRVLDVNRVIGDIQEMLAHAIGEDIELVTVLDPSLGRVGADPGQMNQVITNLVINARDAMPGGGKVVIETANVDLTDANVRGHADAKPGPYVMLSISDTGVGMDAETQSHLFEPFFTTKEPGRGTGLGLSTVYGIVKQSGGHVWVRSEPGQGATFRIYLPRLEQPATPEPVSETEGTDPQGIETILVVEDQLQMRELACEVLRRCGYTVLAAANGAEGIAISEQQGQPLDLLLTDIVMPGMSGSALAAQVRSLRPNIKVLYMSGYPDDEVFRQGVTNTAMGLLRKPFTPEALAKKVREVLDVPVQTSILIVDDAAAMRKVLRLILEEAGYQVIEAADPDQALEQLREQPVDLLITDMVMPGRGGAELLWSLAEEYAGLKVIAMSAFDVELARLPQKPVIQATLTKPMDPAVLLHTVRRVLGELREGGAAAMC